MDKIEVPEPFAGVTSTKKKMSSSTNSGSVLSVHNQVDGTIFSVCIVALQGEVKASDPNIDFQAGKVSLVREWIGALETEHGLRVAEKNLIFRIRFGEEEKHEEEEGKQEERLTEETRKITK